MSSKFESFPDATIKAAAQRSAANAPYNPPRVRPQSLPANGLNNNAAKQTTADMLRESHGNTSPQTPPLPTREVPTDYPQVPNPVPGFTRPVDAGEAISLALPSRFAFYGFKDVYALPFRGRQLSKLSRAHEEQSLLPVVEAVSSVLSTSSGDINIGFKLTVPDFYFILYWLRLNSFTKSSYTHMTKCNNKAHLEKVAAGQLSQDSLNIGQVVTNTNLKVTELETIPDPAVFTLSTGLPLRPVTMVDALELAEHPNVLDTEFVYLAGLASYIGVDAPLDAKVAIADDLSGDDIALIKQYEKVSANYGIDEYVTLRCGACGASKVSKITLDAHSFLSSV